jgi:hypothetical protein
MARRDSPARHAAKRRPRRDRAAASRTD